MVWSVLQVLAELAAWAEACSSGGGATAGRQHTAGPLQLDPAPDVRALMAAIDEVHYLDVGLNCRGAYNTGAHRHTDAVVCAVY